MSTRYSIALALMAACGGAAARGPAAPLRPGCPAGHHWNGASCARNGDSGAALAAGDAALADGEVEAALAQFARARQAGPHGLERYVQIVEKIAIAQAYLAREAEALASFGALLVLDPGHVLSYDVSPQATRPFEKARVQARTRPAPGLQVSWPYDLDVGTAVPVTVEVVADPARSLARAALHVRRRGQRGWAAIDLELAPPGRHRVVHIPAVGGERPEVVQVYLSAFDRAGNEVLRWAGPEQPRDIALAWDPPPPWYRTWWFWAAAGSVLAAGTGIAVFVIADEPPDLIDGGFSF